MKPSEIRELTLDELNASIEDAQRQLFDSRMKNALNQLENRSVFKRLRNQIAQMKTIIGEKQRTPVATATAKTTKKAATKGAKSNAS